MVDQLGKMRVGTSMPVKLVEDDRGRDRVEPCPFGGDLNRPPHLFYRRAVVADFVVGVSEGEVAPLLRPCSSRATTSTLTLAAPASSSWVQPRARRRRFRFSPIGDVVSGMPARPPVTVSADPPLRTRRRSIEAACGHLDELLTVLDVLHVRPSNLSASAAGSGLTGRELEVLVGLSHGRSNAQIAARLFVSEDTVKTHARRLYRKLGASDRAHAVAVAFRAGLLT